MKKTEFHDLIYKTSSAMVENVLNTKISHTECVKLNAQLVENIADALDLQYDPECEECGDTGEVTYNEGRDNEYTEKCTHGAVDDYDHSDEYREREEGR